MLFCKEPVIEVIVQPVHQQRNGVDCGVFSIAFAASIAFREDPIKCNFDISLMRKHLINCLKKENMKVFPKLLNTARIKKCILAKIFIKIYCSCHLIYDNHNDPMVECSKCYEWYHKSCDKVPPRVFKIKNIEYSCKACT